MDHGCNNVIIKWDLIRSKIFIPQNICMRSDLHSEYLSKMTLDILGCPDVGYLVLKCLTRSIDRKDQKCVRLFHVHPRRRSVTQSE